MSELLQVGMLVPAGAAACCAAIDRRRRVAALIPALVMLVAMLDHGLSGLLQRAAIVPGALWFVALLVCAMIAVMPLRAARATRATGATVTAPPVDSGMAVHRALSCIVMAALLLVSELPKIAPAGPSGHVMTGEAMNSGAFLELVLAGGVVAVTALGIALTLRHRGSARLSGLDASAMSLSLVLMFAGHASM